MSNRKVYTHDNLDDFIAEYSKVVNNRLEELNHDKYIILPTEQEYKNLCQTVLEEVTGVGRCLATYSTGINKGKRCQASPQSNSKFCLNHKNKSLDSKDFSDVDNKLIEEVIKRIKRSDLSGQ